MSDAFQCSICLGENDGPAEVQMPCCGVAATGKAPERTIRYCRGCIETLAGYNAGTFKCPTCRKFLQIVGRGAALRVEAGGRRGRCPRCRQEHELVDGTHCEGCILGQEVCLRYRCDRCARVQRIAHPMWRYQPSATAPSSATWACHLRCGDYTHWTVVPEDLARIPPLFVPEAWGAAGALDALRGVVEDARRPAEPRGGWCAIS